LFSQVLSWSFRPKAWALFWPVLVIGGLAAACTSEPDLLNSERIELRYGTYGVRVLHADERHRVSSLYSEEAEGEVCRTFASVDFTLPLDPRLAAEHSLILAGGSIGQVFRQADWQTEKYTLSIGETRAADYSAQIPALMRLDPAAPLAMHRYRFVVLRDGLSDRTAVAPNLRLSDSGFPHRFAHRFARKTVHIFMQLARSAFCD
jgi:hypothetical protein